MILPLHGGEGSSILSMSIWEYGVVVTYWSPKPVLSVQFWLFPFIFFRIQKLKYEDNNDISYKLTFVTQTIKEDANNGSYDIKQRV